jgi:hypothetical protein
VYTCCGCWRMLIEIELVTGLGFCENFSGEEGHGLCLRLAAVCASGVYAVRLLRERRNRSHGRAFILHISGLHALLASILAVARLNLHATQSGLWNSMLRLSWPS